MIKELRDKYNNWNLQKQDIQDKVVLNNIYFNERDIWWCALGINIGSESFGKGSNFRRPILVLKKLSNDLFVGIPLTSKRKVGSWFIDIIFKSEIKVAMLYQIRTIHKNRLQHKMGNIDKKEFTQVKEKLKQLLQLS